MSTVTVDVEVDLNDINDDDMVEHLEERGYVITETEEDNVDILQTIKDLVDVRMYKPEQFDEAFSTFAWNTVGKIV